MATLAGRNAIEAIRFNGDDNDCFVVYVAVRIVILSSDRCENIREKYSFTE